MLRESHRINVLARRSNDRGISTKSGMETVKVPALSAVAVQLSGTCKANGHSAPESVSDCQSLSAESVGEPRNALSFHQWAQISCGIRQRMEAVSMCLNEVFSHATIPEFLSQSASFGRMLRPIMEQIGDVQRKSISWGWLASTDLHVDVSGEITVIDHNLSVPTGIELLSRLVDHSCTESLSAIHDLGRRMADSAFTYGENSDALSTVVLDPCRYSPTFSENEFLARTTGGQIVRAGDLVVTRDGVELTTGSKRTRIHTIVRRIDDDLLDPNCFQPNSLVGLPGLCKAWKNGHVNLVNPPGSGVASIRGFTQQIPAIIRTFLGEKPALQIAESQECSAPEVMRRLIQNPTRFAVRTNDPMHPARPYFGDTATRTETASMLNAVKRNPQHFVTRDLLPDSARRGFSLRVFSTMGDVFYMPRCGIGRNCQADGGATLAINDDASTYFVN
jgi:uncharacterized circularly permuted ATP-grasp superfamily protein